MAQQEIMVEGEFDFELQTNDYVESDDGYITNPPEEKRR